MTEMDGDIARVYTKAARLRHWGYSCVISCVVFAMYWQTRTFQFLNFDDDHYVLENPFVRSGFQLANVRAAFHESRAGHYHPLTWMSHMLDVTFFGLDAGAAHLVNAAFHSLVSALTFGFVWRCVSRLDDPQFDNLRSRYPDYELWIAAAVGLLFGLHPLRLESVAWVAERKDVLSMTFGLLALLAWLDYQQRPSVIRYTLVGLLFGLGLLCKPTLVTVPVLLLGLDLWLTPQRRSQTELFLEKLPFLGMAIASVVITTASQYQDGALQAWSLDTAGARITTAAVAYLAYFGKLFWPVGLGVFYPWVAHPNGVGIGALCGLGALSWVFAQCRTRAPELTFAWFWFLVAPLPVIGLVQFGGQAFADRWTYLPHLGLILGLCIALARFVSPRQFIGITAVATALLSVSTLLNLPHWKDSETLFRHTLHVAPNNFLAHNNLGNALDAKGQLAEATVHYEAAVRLNPTYPEALNNLGTVRARAGRLTEAEQAFERTLKVRPGLTLARYNLGLVRSQLGRPLEALATWLELLRIDPNDERTTASLTALISRHLLPACRQGRVEASSAVLTELVRAAQNTPTSVVAPHLREQLASLSECLDLGVKFDI
jgi:hypothetical protein